MTDDAPAPETTAWPLPAAADATARAWLVAGEPSGAAPRQAASVCLLRDAPGEADRVEVLWITRGRSLAVAPGALAFPGGAVDPVDRVRRRDEPGPPARFAVMARAAARELAEETGHVVAAPALRPLARWVTPEHEPRRFDTTFLVGVLPPAADPEPLPPGEVHEHGWARPADLLEEVLGGRRVALPPTRAVLARLARAADDVPRGDVPRGGAGAGAGAGAGGAAAVVGLLAEQAVLVPVVPRATWRDGDGRDPSVRGVDLLLPRHAGDVP